ncbi:TetR/AcrR family transcriptional regulator C-terminal ligand-binding domain-containing protein [Leucobacter sp. HY1908]
MRDELEEGTYAGLTFEGVAKRAQTSKPVIYRRYASRAHMVLDAWVQYSPIKDKPFVSSGSLRQDILALGRDFSDRFERVGVETMRGLLAEIPADQVQTLTTTSTSWVLDSLMLILDAARERGEISRSPVSPRVLSLPLVLVRHELLFAGKLDDSALAELIDSVWLPLLGSDR